MYRRARDAFDEKRTALNHRTIRELASRMGRRLFSSKERGFFFGFYFVPAARHRAKSRRVIRKPNTLSQKPSRGGRAIEEQYDSLVVGKTKTSAKRTDAHFRRAPLKLFLLGHRLGRVRMLCLEALALNTLLTLQSSPIVTRNTRISIALPPSSVIFAALPAWRGIHGNVVRTIWSDFLIRGT